MPLSLARPGGYEPDIFTALLFKLDENNGAIANDGSANGNIGLITGAQWTVGKYEWGLYFDGVNDYVEVPNSPSLCPTDAITLEAYTDPEGTHTGRGTIIAKHESYFLGIGAPGNMRLRGGIWRNNDWISIVSDATLAPGDFQHVAMTFNGSKLQLFIEGELNKEEDVSPGPFETNTNDVIIGAHRVTANTRSIAGTLDEIRISSVARNPEELDPNM